MSRKKKNYTLGVCYCETSSATLFENGRIISAVSEERFSRKKYDPSFPLKSIKWILKNSEIKLSRVNQISYCWHKGFDKNLDSLYEDRKKDLIRNKKSYKIFNLRKNIESQRDRKSLKKLINWKKNNLNELQAKKLKIYYHHEAHAASAALLSPFNNGLVLTCDARGDYESLTLSFFDRKKKNCLKKIHSSTSSDSLGFFYGRITGLLGYKPSKHEGKITGLAAYGNPTKAINLMRKMITVKQGKLRSNLGDYYKPFFSSYNSKLIKEIKRFRRADIAAAAQYHLEWCLIKLLTYHFKKNKIKSQKNLMLAGGVFANVKLNQALKSLKFIKNIFVQPQMNDGGLCIGAALLSIHGKRQKISPLKNVYLGPEINKEKLILLLKKNKKIDFYEPSLIYKDICNDLYDNKVIGLVRGKMEFGPRALCNRSIIYKTSDKTVNDWLNIRLKRTEFMPFAPVIREEISKCAFKNFSKKDISLNFMTSTIDCTNKFKFNSPAVTHVDQTARPQIVSKSSDKFMWNLLKEWETVSGEMSLINTSFNVHEEPIICNEQEAINSLLKGIIDILYIENLRVILR